MSESNKKTHKNDHRNYSIYDNMSTEALEEILRADSQFSDTEDFDTDTILYILEVIEKREKENLTRKFTDVDAAWESFNKNYLPYLGSNKSLYDDEDVLEGLQSKLVSSQKYLPLQNNKHLIRVASIVAIVTVVFFTGTATAKAFGFNLWTAVAKWTEDIFKFSVAPSNNQELNDELKKTLDKYNVSIKAVPTWFPEGYSFESSEVIESPMNITIYSIYSSKNGKISVTIISLVDSSTSVYEKDNEDVITYSFNGIQHYIMKNLERTKVVWMVDNYECSITGEFTIKEAKKMINSIY